MGLLCHVPCREHNRTVTRKNKKICVVVDVKVKLKYIFWYKDTVCINIICAVEEDKLMHNDLSDLFML